jgi:hypothetical protein
VITTSSPRLASSTSRCKSVWLSLNVAIMSGTYPFARRLSIPLAFGLDAALQTASAVV